MGLSELKSSAGRAAFLSGRPKEQSVTLLVPVSRGYINFLSCDPFPPLSKPAAQHLSDCLGHHL